jgi:hypothetical protein
MEALTTEQLEHLTHALMALSSMGKEEIVTYVRKVIAQA